ncbi:MAG TPA: MarR family winged helix-turn-helix transcriptional regulator [Solirubrobacteraceae bacterium]|jgi:DNA-binding MarR family transcriptional regulator|nr:MarR family winged helix-turn-helix transcriptional regulator [Solirubrobacteraceae bacterium]
MPVGTPTVEQQSLVLINHLARIARRSFEAALTPLGLRPRHVVALTLLRDRGAMTQVALGETLCQDPTNLVGLLNELERAALLARRRDPADRRRHIVEISAQGNDVLAEADAALAAVQGEVLAALDAEERETLHRLLARATDGEGAVATCAEEIPLGCAPGELDAC